MWFTRSRLWFPRFGFNRCRVREPGIPGWQTKIDERVSPATRRTFTTYHAGAREFQRKLPSSSRRDETRRDPNERRIERGTKTVRIPRGQLRNSSATMRQPSSSETVPDAFWHGQRSRNRSIRHERIVFSDATRDSVICHPLSLNQTRPRFVLYSHFFLLVDSVVIFIGNSTSFFFFWFKPP